MYVSIHRLNFVVNKTSIFVTRIHYLLGIKKSSYHKEHRSSKGGKSALSGRGKERERDILGFREQNWKRENNEDIDSYILNREEGEI